MHRQYNEFANIDEGKRKDHWGEGEIERWGFELEIGI